MPVDPIAGAERALDIHHLARLEQPEVRFRQRLRNHVKPDHRRRDLGDGQADAIDGDALAQPHIAPLRRKIERTNPVPSLTEAMRTVVLDDAGEHLLETSIDPELVRDKSIATPLPRASHEVSFTSPRISDPGPISLDIPGVTVRRATIDDLDRVRAAVQDTPRTRRAHQPHGDGIVLWEKRLVG